MPIIPVIDLLVHRLETLQLIVRFFDPCMVCTAH